MSNRSHPAGRRARWAVLCALSLLGACSRPAPPAEPVRAVKLRTVTAGPLVAGREFAGEVRARVESQLGFRVGGKMVRRQAETGQRVQAGQLLAQLDPQDLRLAADAARAQVAAATTNRELAAADFGRYRELKARNFISGAELDRRESTLKGAQAAFDQARAQQLAQGNQTAYANLTADVAGVVTAVLAEPGQVVAAGAPVLRIAQDGPRDVVFAVPEDQVARMVIGAPVEVRQWSTDTRLEGRVREVGASADPATRTYAVKVAIDAAAAWPLGSTVYVMPRELDRAGTTAITLPTSALRQEGGASAVWVLDRASMTLRSQPVQVDTADGNDAVIAAGLSPGMEVVVAGVHVLSAGQKVTIYEQKVPPAQALPGQAATENVANPASTASRPTVGSAASAPVPAATAASAR